MFQEMDSLEPLNQRLLGLSILLLTTSSKVKQVASNLNSITSQHQHLLGDRPQVSGWMWKKKMFKNSNWLFSNRSITSTTKKFEPAEILSIGLLVEQLWVRFEAPRIPSSVESWPRINHHGIGRRSWWQISVSRSHDLFAATTSRRTNQHQQLLPSSKIQTIQRFQRLRELFPKQSTSLI